MATRTAFQGERLSTIRGLSIAVSLLGVGSRPSADSLQQTRETGLAMAPRLIAKPSWEVARAGGRELGEPGLSLGLQGLVAGTLLGPTLALLVWP